MKKLTNHVRYTHHQEEGNMAAEERGPLLPEFHRNLSNLKTGDIKTRSVH